MNQSPAISRSAPPERSPAEQLATPVQFLKGVGPDRAKLLERIGLRTAADVLFTFLRDYQDLTDLRSIEQLEDDKLQSVRGTVEEIDLRNTGTGRSIVGCLVREGRRYLRACGSTCHSWPRSSAAGRKCCSPGSRSSAAGVGKCASARAVAGKRQRRKRNTYRWTIARLCAHRRFETGRPAADRTPGGRELRRSGRGRFSPGVSRGASTVADHEALREIHFPRARKTCSKRGGGSFIRKC